MSKSYPETVPMLRAQDFVKGVVGENGESCQHCMLGWVEVVFGSGSTDDKLTSECAHTYSTRRKLQLSMECAILEAVPALAGSCTLKDPSMVNDNSDISCSTLAKIWNRAMYLLGYTEGNSAKKPLRKCSYDDTLIY